LDRITSLLTASAQSRLDIYERRKEDKEEKKVRRLKKKRIQNSLENAEAVQQRNAALLRHCITRAGKYR
jgi:hypothetical protein